MQTKPRPKLLKLSEVRRHPNLQPRVDIDPNVVAEYAEALRDGAKFPPVTVVFDRTYYFLSDGWHRYEAHLAASIGEIQADVLDGTFRDAQLYALGANWNHGKRRTNDDKRRAVGMLLDDEEWSKWSDADIAKTCHVSQPFVAKIRAASHADVSEDEGLGSVTLNVLGEDAGSGEGISSGVTSPTVPEAAQKKADDVRASGGEPRFYRNKHGDVGVMDVSKMARGKKSEAAATAPSSRDNAVEDSSPQPDSDEVWAEMDSLRKQVSNLNRQIDSLNASDQAEEISKLAQQVFHLENRVGDLSDKTTRDAKRLNWFGAKFAELRKLTGAKEDRDVVGLVRRLVEGGQ